MGDFSIFSILNTGVLGTYTSKLAMSITAHNISNANTEGFSRQRPDIRTTPPIAMGSLTQPNVPMFLGTGSLVKQVERVRDAFLDVQYRNVTQNFSFWDKTAHNLHYMEQILQEPSEDGFRQYFDKLWFSFQEVMGNPTNAATLEQVQSEAQNFIRVYQDLYERYEELRSNLNADIPLTVQNVNSILENIASLSQQIRSAYTMDTSPNDILDERDRLLDELNTLVEAKYRLGTKGHLEIYVGGQIVLNDDHWSPIETPIRPNTQNLYDTFIRSTKIEVSGGHLGAMFELRDETIPRYLDRFDELALMMVDKLNLIHRTGFDKTGSISGVDFFQEMEATRSSLPNLFRLAGTHSILDGPIHMAISEIQTNPASTTLGRSGKISFVDLNNSLYEQAFDSKSYTTGTSFQTVIEDLNGFSPENFEMLTLEAKNLELQPTQSRIHLSDFAGYKGNSEVFYQTKTSGIIVNGDEFELENLIDINGDGEFNNQDIVITDSVTGTTYANFDVDLLENKIILHELPNTFSGSVDVVHWKRTEKAVEDGFLSLENVGQRFTNLEKEVASFTSGPPDSITLADGAFGGDTLLYYVTEDSSLTSVNGSFTVPDLIDINDDTFFDNDDIRIQVGGVDITEFSFDEASGEITLTQAGYENHSGAVTIRRWQSSPQSIVAGVSGDISGLSPVSLDFSQPAATIADFHVIDLENANLSDQVRVFLRTLRSDEMNTTTGAYKMLFGKVDDGINENGTVDSEKVGSLGTLEDLLVIDRDGLLARMGFNTHSLDVLEIGNVDYVPQTHQRDGLEGIWWLDGNVNTKQFVLSHDTPQQFSLTEFFYPVVGYDSVSRKVSVEGGDFQGPGLVYFVEEQAVDNANKIGPGQIQVGSIIDANEDGIIDSQDISIQLVTDTTVPTTVNITQFTYNAQTGILDYSGDPNFPPGFVGNGLNEAINVRQWNVSEANFSEGTMLEGLSATISPVKLDFSDTTPLSENDFLVKKLLDLDQQAHILYVTEETGKQIHLENGMFAIPGLIDIDDDQEITSSDLRIRIGGTDITSFHYDSDLQKLVIDDPAYSEYDGTVTMDLRRWKRAFIPLENGTFSLDALPSAPVSLAFDGVLSERDFRVFKEPVVDKPQPIEEEEIEKSVTFSVPKINSDGETVPMQIEVVYRTDEELLYKINHNTFLKDYIKGFEFNGRKWIAAKPGLAMDSIHQMVTDDPFNTLSSQSLSVLDTRSYDNLANVMYSFSKVLPRDYDIDTAALLAPNQVDLTLKSNLNEYQGKVKLWYTARENNGAGGGFTVDPTTLKVELGNFSIQDSNGDGVINSKDIKIIDNSVAAGGEAAATALGFRFDPDSGELFLSAAPVGNVDIVYQKSDEVFHLQGTPGSTYTLTLQQAHLSGVFDQDFRLDVQLPPDEMQMTLGTSPVDINLNTMNLSDAVETINGKVPTGIMADLTPDQKLVFRAGRGVDFSFGRRLEDGRIVQTYDLQAPTIFWEKMGYLTEHGTFGNSWEYDVDVVKNYLNPYATMNSNICSDNLDLDTRQADGLYGYVKRLKLSSQLNANPMLLAVDFGKWVDTDGDWISDVHIPRGGASSSIPDFMATARNAKLVDDGRVEFDDFLGMFVSEMGLDSQTATRMKSNNELMRIQIDNERERVKGVSLDEEMSNMIKYQQAFNAAARVITAVDEMIQRIVDGLGLVGR
ncbi:MAG TPA: flagellar hook-associated protein FlgK [Thermotogota bacterium]|nr:flagellar hook-associated protein FlgK [Thermotogota bacterium]